MTRVKSESKPRAKGPAKKGAPLVRGKSPRDVAIIIAAVVVVGMIAWSWLT